jgi:hypothetical protein
MNVHAFSIIMMLAPCTNKNKEVKVAKRTKNERKKKQQMLSVLPQQVPLCTEFFVHKRKLFTAT